MNLASCRTAKCGFSCHLDDSATIGLCGDHHRSLTIAANSLRVWARVETPGLTSFLSDWWEAAVLFTTYQRGKPQPPTCRGNAEGAKLPRR